MTYEISLTGHRPGMLWGYDLKDKHYRELYNILYYLAYLNLIKHDKIICHSGMALGVDTVWAYAISSLKHKFPNNVEFIADIPFRKQCDKWPESDKDTYYKLLKNSDKQVIYEDKYSKGCMFERNRGLVDNSDLLIAVCKNNINTGGTHYTINYAKTNKKKILMINPDLIRI